MNGTGYSIHVPIVACTATAFRSFDCLILMSAQDRTVSAVVTELNNIASVLEVNSFAKCYVIVKLQYYYYYPPPPTPKKMARV